MSSTSGSEHQGKFAILGASGGIGSALARLLVHHGHSVFLLGRDLSKVSDLGKELGASYTVRDVFDFSGVEAMLNEASESLGGLTGVACLTGSLVLKPAHLTSESDLSDLVAAHLTPAFAAVRASVKHFRGQGGSIALVSSAASLIGLANHEGIAAVKGAINGLTLSAAATYAKDKIRVNAVAPGLVETPLTVKITASDVALKASTAMHPLGRIGQAEEIASALYFFLDAKNSWITGQILAIDGGLSGLKVPK